MDGEYSTDSAGSDADVSKPADTTSVQHPPEFNRQKSLAYVSTDDLTYQNLAEQEDEEFTDGDARELVPVSEDADQHMVSIRRLGDDTDNNPESQIQEAARVDAIIRNTIESVLDGPGVVALRANDHVLHRRGQMDPTMTDDLKQKISTSAVILVSQEKHTHRWNCCVM